jgi:alkylation response protein AidB-like acyl-CoA dehydrogenase
MEFGVGEEAEAFAAETRAFFDGHLTPAWHAKSHYSYDGHDWDLYKEMGRRGLLFPTWKKEFGGRGLSRFANHALVETWGDFEVTTHAQSVSVMVGAVIEKFGSQRLKDEYLHKLGKGEVISCLGYTEPSSGSDSFAAKTKAVRGGDGWLINGQKMFTSGANLASHLLLLTRTDPDAPKHAGLTLFVVPMDDPGVHVDPVYTYQDERTNATFYADVRIPDWRRVGEVNGGAELFGWALSLEQGGGGFIGPHRRTVETAVQWARETLRDGKPAIENERVLERLARTYVHARISRYLYLRTVWQLENDIADRAAGPLSKVFSSETFLRDATDLLDLAAPDTLLRGKHALGLLELSSRHASATTIYAGTSEVHRSQVAEKALGLPRSR